MLRCETTAHWMLAHHISVWIRSGRRLRLKGAHRVWLKTSQIIHILSRVTVDGVFIIIGKVGLAEDVVPI